MQVKYSQLFRTIAREKKPLCHMCGLQDLIKTHKHIAVRRHAGISIIHVVDAAVIEHSRRITLIYSAAREIDCIGVHNSRHTRSYARLAGCGAHLVIGLRIEEPEANGGDGGDGDFRKGRNR